MSDDPTSVPDEDWSFDRHEPVEPIGEYVDESGVESFEESRSHGRGAEAMADWDDAERHMVEYFFATGLADLAAARKERGVLFSPDTRAASLVQSAISELVDDGVLDTRTLDTGVREVKYDGSDPGWVPTALGWIRDKLNWRRFDWVRPESPGRLPDDVRVAIIGDWGSGRYGARGCAESIVGDPEGFDLVVHLGDVYYSGTTKEVKRNFLAVWPWETAPRHDAVTFRACNSNHEMYSGGKPYVNLTLREFGQSSSAWALENDEWLFVGLDTAYEEWELAEQQGQWLRRLLARDDGRRAILFSHHQPFSHLSSTRASFVDEVARTFADYTDKIHAWYWGHEHLAAVYEPDDRWGLHGRCVGHGGFPYFREEAVRTLGGRRSRTPDSSTRLVTMESSRAPKAVVLDGPNEHIGGDAEQEARYGPNGYMTLHATNGAIHEELRSPRAELIWDGEI